ncbi:MAG: helix-turn-helix transcriptional regulator [Clostridia bacterium]|nr:helix-turn-helix transcriptional regulator [Clostridia bacterium]
MDKFAKRLKELRLEKGLSLRELGKLTKIGAASLCRWENCQSDVSGSQLITLAKFFKVSADYLLGLEDW